MTRVLIELYIGLHEPSLPHPVTGRCRHQPARETAYIAYIAAVDEYSSLAVDNRSALIARITYWV